MSETVAAIHAVEATTRIPANLMALLRQSYDTREKVLDWCLALGVAGVAVYVFRDELRGMIQAGADPGPNAGLADFPQPNQSPHSAFPARAPAASLYTYNMPMSRDIRHGNTTSSTPPPSNPSLPPILP